MRMIALISALIMAFASSAHAGTKNAYFAGGCFWCVESDFESVKGVKEVVSGFSGGKTKNPTYKSHGKHIEAVKITYDDSVVSYETLVNKFLRSVDVLDSGGQFCDRGHTYTTAIFTSNAAEKATAKSEVAKASAELGKKVVTPVRNAGKFYAVDDYHQDYYKSNEKVLTRFGLVTKAKAYKGYREGCGRDARVKALWGSSAAFSH